MRVPARACAKARTDVTRVKNAHRFLTTATRWRTQTETAVLYRSRSLHGQVSELMFGTPLARNDVRDVAGRSCDARSFQAVITASPAGSFAIATVVEVDRTRRKIAAKVPCAPIVAFLRIKNFTRNK